MSLEQHRRLLRKEFALGVANRRNIDRILDVAAHDAEDDLRSTLSLADTEALHRMRAALVSGHLVRRAYRGHSNNGCLVFFLLNFTSNEDLLNYPYDSLETLNSVCRTVRRWDYEEMTSDTVLRILDETIQERSSKSSLEDAAVQGSATPSPKRWRIDSPRSRQESVNVVN
jgi:hypothetical protein